MVIFNVPEIVSTIFILILSGFLFAVTVGIIFILILICIAIWGAWRDRPRKGNGYPSTPIYDGLYDE